MDESGSGDGLLALLTPAQMSLADRMTIEAGVPGIELMERAGSAVAAAIKRRLAPEGSVLVLCGPGNNGGDGFIAARLLNEAGYRVKVLLLGAVDHLKGDAAQAFGRMGVVVGEMKLAAVEASLANAHVVIDALFGAGLDRPLSDEVGAIVSAVNAAPVPVVSVDLPSGVNGASGEILGWAMQAEESVTFFRKKPGHLLFPGRAQCGKVSLNQIGIDKIALDKIGVDVFENSPGLWLDAWPLPAITGHKFSRGHALVFSGGITSSGAARLGAVAALRAGAGLVTLASPPSAIMANASHLTAVMLKSVADSEGVIELLSDPRYESVLIGPGFGLGDKLFGFVEAILSMGRRTVLDADALSGFAEDPERLFSNLRDSAGEAVLTPHMGEFLRLFPDLADLDKLSAARKAAERCGSVIVLKGADTVIAGPDGFAAINCNASPWLATAGSGDVLAGIVCGLLVQGMPAFEAASMGVWLHGAAGQEVGPGLIAEDLAAALRPVFVSLVEKAGERDHKKRF